MEANISYLCCRCKYNNVKDLGCNYDSFMREIGSRNRHVIGEDNKCSGFDEKK